LAERFRKCSVRPRGHPACRGIVLSTVIPLPLRLTSPRRFLDLPGLMPVIEDGREVWKTVAEVKAGQVVPAPKPKPVDLAAPFATSKLRRA
jgi:hypothetical protein